MFRYRKIKRVYLDWAAATPMRSEVVKAMRPYQDKCYGNPSAIHTEGIVAKQAIEKAREQVATALQVRPELITFTGGGTEGNNLAIIGLIEALCKDGKSYEEMEVITTKLEHPSVSKTINRLAVLGVRVQYLEVGADGQVKIESLNRLLSKQTVLVSVSYANSEIGVIQPLRLLKKQMSIAEKKFASSIYFHVDGAQAPLWLNCRADYVGADLFTLDASKYQGPKGVGVLVKSRRVPLCPVWYGGGQENGLRSGTENVPGIVGAGIALQLATQGYKTRVEHVSKVRDAAISLITTLLPNAILNGPLSENRIANNINISLPGLDTEYAAVVLDNAGFAVSTKSACSGAGGEESLVVREISHDATRAGSTLRITLGPEVELAQLKRLLRVLVSHQAQMSVLTK